MPNANMEMENINVMFAYGSHVYFVKHIGYTS